MEKIMAEIIDHVEHGGCVPTFADMPHRKLENKGIAGPTAAHVIEEIHTPFNFAGLTFTTGSSAFQNIVGITHAELPHKIAASKKILQMAGVKPGDKMIVSYPPLVNVFNSASLEEYGVEWRFLTRSNKDSLIAALYEYRPRVVVGESCFINGMLKEVEEKGIAPLLPTGIIFLTAGTPLKLDVLETAERVLHAEVHDLYGCQEFGWLAIDGIPVREDISLVDLPNTDLKELVVGGLPMGDSFPVTEEGHICNKAGKILTYARERTYPEYEVIVKASPIEDKSTLERTARSILRIKGRIVKVSPDVQLGADHTILELRPDAVTSDETTSIIIEGPQKTQCFEDMVQAQLEYQQRKKSDPTWIKRS